MEKSSLVDSQVLRSSSLDSPSSEPPDIRNWFSSYVYESPELDSNDMFGDSISKEREIGKDELTADDENGVIEENFGEFRDVTKIDEEEADEKLPRTWIPLKCTPLEDHHESQPLGLNQDSWCSQSLLSEPPDVGNWFSSYVYESPTLNPSQEFGSCGSDNTGLGDEIEENLEIVKKTTNGAEEVQLNLFLKCNGSSRGNRQEEQPLGENLSSERTSEQDPKEKSLGAKRINPTKEVPNSSLITEEDGSASVPLHINGSSNNANTKLSTRKNLVHKTDLMLENSQSEVQTQLDGSSRKWIDSSHKKEKTEKRVWENGLVTASKREICGATCKKSVERQENFNNKETGSAFACLRRTALSDKTNVEHSNIVEITGKWSCPRKSKPNLGPPLKQLRLERWVRKG
ncbi:uncharacterized protein LOC111024941 isoform X2 [Momordica charantia]|uniref:Uncharacterized protein LOC111024941 isoform X2 n=1 Tax=Momordica charantia TaxID=3673 RepID=A0A6J1DW51_MOMCH|nr:uncharacterized protein LOC111024941 isoform X2 [Momordica charantia]